MKIISVSTDELRNGELLFHHGMLVRLSNRSTYPSATNPDETVYVFAGRVENMDEVYPSDADTAVWPLSSLLRRDGVWDIQGNRLAWWGRVVEREA